MTLEAFAAVAEIVNALAVTLTLIVLIVSIRQNRLPEATAATSLYDLFEGKVSAPADALYRAPSDSPPVQEKS